MSAQMSAQMSPDVIRCGEMSGGIASFKSKGNRCVLKDGPLRKEVADYISK
jgi:hypothetical protein